MARHTLPLPPHFATRRPIGADVPPSGPAVIGALLVRTQVRLGVAAAPPSPREGEHGGRGGRSRRTGLHGSLTRVAERLVEEAREGFGRLASLLEGFGGSGSCRARSVPTPEPHPQQEHAE